MNRYVKVQRALDVANDELATQNLEDVYQTIEDYIKDLESTIKKFNDLGCSLESAPTISLSRGDMYNRLGDKFSASLSDRELAVISREMINDGMMEDWWYALDYWCERLYPEQYIPWDKREKADDEQG